MFEGPKDRPLTIKPDTVESPDKETPLVQAPQTLTELAILHELFTPALICTVGRFDRDPVVEFNRYCPESDAALQPFSLDFDQPLFGGLGRSLLAGQTIRWSRRLYAIHRERWPECRDFLAGLVAMDARRKFWSRAAFHELPLRDPTSLAVSGAGGDSPAVVITSFAIATPQAFFWLAAKVGNIPVLRRGPPRKDLEPNRAVDLGLPVQGVERAR